MESVFRGHPDHDACGTGFIVQLGKSASREVVDRALEALRRLTHRGGADADGCSGDGVGLLTELPQDFLRQQAEDLDIKLPATFALGMLFLRSAAGENAQARSAIAKTATASGLRFLGWREVPLRPSVLGNRAAETVPSIWQCFIGAGSEAQDKNLETELFLFRKRVDTELGS